MQFEEAGEQPVATIRLSPVETEAHFLTEVASGFCQLGSITQHIDNFVCKRHYITRIDYDIRPPTKKFIFTRNVAHNQGQPQPIASAATKSNPSSSPDYARTKGATKTAARR